MANRLTTRRSTPSFTGENGRGGADGPLPTLTSELKLVPAWSVAAAACAFTAVLYLFWVVVPAHRHHEPPLGLRLYFALSWSALSALYLLMVGYISQDTRRRAMRARLWIVVCLVLPGGIGAVLYFLLRAPVVAFCPACGTRVAASYHYCPQCVYQLQANCRRCFGTMNLTDRFCVSCGMDRVAEEAPQRLYAFRDEQ